MSPVTTSSDPRRLVTPDAFEVSAELLGLPLAPPWRRMVALLVDLVVIGVVTLVTRSFAVLLGVVVAVLFIRAAFKRTPVRGSVFGRAMRLSVGCLGVVVAGVTAVVWTALRDEGPSSAPDTDELTLDVDPSAAVLEAMGLGGIRGRQGEPLGAAAVPDTAGLPAEVAEALRAVEARNEALEDENARLRSAVDALGDAVVEAAEAPDDGGIFDWLRELVGELGFGFGWASLYMTVVLTAWKGQTVGKRLLGIRVVRLDGEPITWWLAFERAGGYAAGFATGLLGFAQVYWDANRQAIHDRIAGTVVVIHGAERVGDWQAVVR